MRTCRWPFLVLAILFCLRSAEAQAVRWDSFVSTVNGQAPPGALAPLLVIPGTQVNFCTGSGVGVVSTAGTIVTLISGPSFAGAAGTIQIAGRSYTISTVVSSSILVIATSAGTQTSVPYSSLSGCLANPVTTYTDAAAGTPCPTTAQLTPQLGGACVATADGQGNYGGWFLPGSYYYYLRTPATAGGVVSGPYPISMGASAGTPSGTTIDANYATLALACTAAGNGTLYITRVWNATPTQSLGCSLNFLGNSKIVTAASATVTITGTVTAPFGQWIFDSTTNSGAAFLFSGTRLAAIYDQWFGASGLPGACAAGANTGAPVYITTAWLNVASMSCTGFLNFQITGSIQPAANSFFSTRGYTGSTRQVLWDLSNSGSSIRIAAPATGQALYAANFSTFAGACSTAASYGSTLHVQIPVTSLTTQSCAASLEFEAGGMVQPASGQTVTISGPLDASPMSQIFDVSLSGSHVYFGSGSVVTSYPQWFGAKADASHDDTTAIQAAIDSCRGVNSGGISDYIAVCQVILPASGSVYKTTGQINMYSSTGVYRGMTFCGTSKQSSRISYVNASPASAIRMIGLFQKVCSLSIINAASSGWLDGIQYDGQSDIGISTGGKIEDVEMELLGNIGNGISTGRSGYQADQLTIDHMYVNGNFIGSAFRNYDPNALSINIYNPSINSGQFGIYAGPSSNLNVYGGEIDNMDVNFVGASGSIMLISGVRSEGSKRSFWSGLGQYSQPTTFQNYLLSTNNLVRPTTTAAGTNGTNVITLSVRGFTIGDPIVIAGAGPAGADLHAEINGVAAGATIFTINANLSSTITAASVTLDGSVQYYSFIEDGGGPYVHQGGTVYTVSGGEVRLTNPAVNATQTFTGVSWEENITNPFNLPITTACPSTASWSGLFSNNTGAFTAIPNFSLQVMQAANFVSIQAASSQNNAIVGSPGGWCYPSLMPGLIAQIQLGGGYTIGTVTGTVNTVGPAVTWVSGEKFYGQVQSSGLGRVTINSVQYSVSAATPTTLTLTTSAGTQSGVAYSSNASTFNYAGTGVIPIKSHCNFLVDGTNQYSINSSLLLLYTAGVWEDQGSCN